MTDSSPSRAHGPIAKLFHWSFVAVFAYAVYKGLDNVRQLRDPGLLQFEMIFAGGFLLLLAARFVYMRWAGPTALPEDTAKPVKTLAKFGHLAMYGSVAMIAVSGLAIGTLYASGITGGALMGAVVGSHELFVNASYVLVGGHIVAALMHRIMGDGVWSSMVPVFKERR